MSVLGSGLAAGVAQTSVQAGQVARQIDARHARVSDDADRIRQFIAAQRRGEAIPDEAEVTSQGRAEEQNPNGHTQQEANGGGASPDSPVTASESEPVTPTPGVDGGTASRLYHHLDVSA